MPSIFSRIVAGEIPCHKIAENDKYFAFLDINPVAKGHTLVIPKQETDYIFDLDDQQYSGLWQFAHTVARALKQAIPCIKVGITVLGLEVPHAHIHLVPMAKETDMNFFAPKQNTTAEELAEVAAKIRAAYESLQK